jgi:polyisoprenoid-binding protein YceI
MRYFLIIVGVVACISGRAQQTLRADKANSSIKYFMKHALHSWQGVSQEVNSIIQLNAQGDIEKVAATVPVKSFDSKNSNRDSHMLEVTDALTHPNVSFFSTSVSKTVDGYDVKGMLNFHGVEKPVNIQAKEVRQGGHRTITGSFIFLLEDHKVERPTLMMVKTDNEVRIAFSFSY